MSTGEEPPLVSLPQYEGPLDLLLDLVRTHQLNILDLPIAEVTSQYLAYLRRARDFNVDLGADFILMAATLIHIKSRTLLPPRNSPGHDDGDPDPRQELVEQLLTREQAQHAAALLAERFRAADETWSVTVSGTAGPAPEPTPTGTTRGRAETMNLVDVLRVAKTALATAKAHRLLNLKREPVTVEGMMRWLGQKLNQVERGQFLASTDLFAAQATAERRAALFLALLEMARAQDISLRQEEFLSPFHISAASQLHS